MHTEQLLIDLLNRPGPVSGTEIGEALGVSRVAVQKRIQHLIELGLPIQAVAGKGYTLDQGIILLSPSAIRDELNSPLVDSVYVLQSIDSSNSYLLQQGVLNGRAKICVTESQSAGRGRRGNEWKSSAYRNMMLSLSWGFDHWPETITGLGLAVSLVVAEYLNKELDSFGLPQVNIKWPNDLMVEKDKLGGILIDVAGESSGACNVIIGVGLNVHQPDWSQESDYRWQDLSSLGLMVNRNTLTARLCTDLVNMLDDFGRTGFEPLANRWNGLSSYANARIKVGGPEEFVEGVMHGVDAIGALLLKLDNGEIKRFTDSNVSVRLV